jgi:hypothetical protein
MLEVLIVASGNVETMESDLRASVSLCKGVHDIMGDDVTPGTTIARHARQD